MRTVNQNSLDNLRPVSATPERARAFAKVHGIGGPLDKRPRCQAFAKSRGRTCRDLAAFGTTRCKRHGARLSKNAPPPPPEAQEARAAMAFLHSREIPLDLTRDPAWIAACAMRFTPGTLRRAALLVAWLAGTETGDWGPWRNLLKS